MGIFSRAASPNATQQPAGMGNQQQQQAPLPGQYFDVPGINGGSTQWTEQDETTPNLVTQMTPGNSVQIVGILPYRQTDVVVDWAAEFTFALTYTGGTGQTLTASPYAPFNLIGQVQQTVQNQYASVNVESGIDWYIFNLIRPEKKSNRRLNLYANPAGSAVGGTAGIGYWADALAQANQVNTDQWSTASTTFKTKLRLPAAQWFDSYYDLAVTGEPVTAAHPALVSPQFQAGTTRVITPSFVLNPGFSTTLDNGPVNTTTVSGNDATASTFTGTATLNLRRKAVYAGNPAFQPPVYAWQYRWKTQRFGLSGVSTTDILIPLDTGQLLSTYVRMFDPLANDGLGAPILPAVVTKVQFQYGSGLFWFNGTPDQNQMVWLEQHGFLLPEGVFGFDFALDERDGITNKRAFNTLTTGGLLVHIDFTTPCSAAAYAVLGTESLVYVV
jgi:hypothetical protein